MRQPELSRALFLRLNPTLGLEESPIDFDPDHNPVPKLLKIIDEMIEEFSQADEAGNKYLRDRFSSDVRHIKSWYLAFASQAKKIIDRQIIFSKAFDDELLLEALRNLSYGFYYFDSRDFRGLQLLLKKLGASELELAQLQLMVYEQYPRPGIMKSGQFTLENLPHAFSVLEVKFNENIQPEEPIYSLELFLTDEAIKAILVELTRIDS